MTPPCEVMMNFLIFATTLNKILIYWDQVGNKLNLLQRQFVENYKNTAIIEIKNMEAV